MVNAQQTQTLQWSTVQNHEKGLSHYLVLILFVFSSVSPSLKANVEGLSSGFAKSIIVSHCSAVAKLGKYNALGYQLNTLIHKQRNHFHHSNKNPIFNSKRTTTTQNWSKYKPGKGVKSKTRLRSPQTAAFRTLFPAASFWVYGHHHLHPAKKYKV